MTDLNTILSNFQITALNEMQTASIDAILKPSDFILISPTGSGKTLAFLIPILELLQSDLEMVQVLIVVPTRELAIQIEKVFRQMGTGFKVNSCYGGHSIGIEINNLQQPPAILVGTPGRIAHHLRHHYLDLVQTHTMILDEFDKSLEFGFKVEMEYIIQQAKNLKKRILTSATSLLEIPDFVGLNEHISLNFTNDNSGLKSALVMKSVRVEGDDKLEALILLLGKIGSNSTIVFCNHRETVNRISEQLSISNIEHGAYHGGLEQIDRERTLIKLRNGSVNLLVTTDLAARGLDIPEIEAVIHYHLPPTEDVMIHRNGRTARMNANGTSYFLLDHDDYLPKFITTEPEVESLPKDFIPLKTSEWKTLYIAAGKKDKINKMDIVGMLLKKGELQKHELGRVDVLDHSSYVAIQSNKIYQCLQRVKSEKIKNKKVRFDISK
jgi:ATP-independent RNA helicase DbpA